MADYYYYYALTVPYCLRRKDRPLALGPWPLSLYNSRGINWRGKAVPSALRLATHSTVSHDSKLRPPAFPLGIPLSRYPYALHAQFLSYGPQRPPTKPHVS